MRQDRLAVAVLPLAELGVKGPEALRLRGPLPGRHLQALGTPCRAPNEEEQQWVGAPGEEGTGCLGSEDLGWEEDGPALGLDERSSY